MIKVAIVPAPHHALEMVGKINGTIVKAKTAGLKRFLCFGLSKCFNAKAAKTTTTAVDSLLKGFGTLTGEISNTLGAIIPDTPISVELGRFGNQFRLQNVSGFAPTVESILQRFDFDPSNPKSIEEAMANLFISIASTKEENDELIANINAIKGETGSTAEAIASLLNQAKTPTPGTPTAGARTQGFVGPQTVQRTAQGIPTVAVRGASIRPSFADAVNRFRTEQAQGAAR